MCQFCRNVARQVLELVPRLEISHLLLVVKVDRRVAIFQSRVVGEMTVFLIIRHILLVKK